MRNKTLLTLLGALTVSAVMTVTAFAGIGEWRQNDYGYWWQRTDGSYPANTWKSIDGNGDGIAECYHFDRSGYMDSDTWVDGYYVGNSGAWIANGYIQQHNYVQGIDEVRTPATDYQRPGAVNNALAGFYEMHTELVDCYIRIEKRANGVTYATYTQVGYHEDGSNATCTYDLELQEVSGGHYVGDEVTYSGDMITFDWLPGMKYLSNVKVNGAYMGDFSKN